MKQRVDLDTSVISAIDDMRWPDRAEMTRLFWSNREQYEVATSEVARQEIERTSDVGRRSQMLALLDDMTVHPLTADIESLASEYVKANVFPETVLEDALHVAAAVLTRSEVLLSWSFKHLVNRRRRAAVTAINLACGLPVVEIGVISITIFPLVAPLAIVFGVRTHRACKAHGVHGLPRVFSIGGVILGALTIVAWTFFIVGVFLESTWTRSSGLYSAGLLLRLRRDDRQQHTEQHHCSATDQVPHRFIGVSPDDGLV